ncbi:hypothetical protein JET67_00390 [Pseudomonas palleroniana]|nr:hypothetical protein [Pseudomonas palleroniana]
MATKYPKHPRYIPVIKWQSWEQKALQKVEGAIRPRMLPCIEVRTSKQHLNLLKNLNKVWPYDALVDYADPKGRLTPVRTGELLSFMKFAVDERWPVTPVVSPADVIATGKPFLGFATMLGKVAVRLRNEWVGEYKLRLIRISHISGLMTNDKKQHESNVKSHFVILFKSSISVGHPSEIGRFL